MKTNLAKLGNHLYIHAPALYRPLYSAYKAFSDRNERAAIAGVIGAGATVLDVGANIGVYTRFFARLVGPRGKVIALEPEQENFRRLQAAIVNTPWVEARCVAASDRTGECVLYRSDSLNVDHQTYDSGEGRQRTAIPAVRLDDVVAPGQRVDFIKMDIQGFETAALAGAQRILSENRGLVLLFEYWPYAIRRSGEDPAALLQSLRDLGYRLKVLGEDVGTREGLDDYCNILASHAA